MFEIKCIRTGTIVTRLKNQNQVNKFKKQHKEYSKYYSDKEVSASTEE